MKEDKEADIEITWLGQAGFLIQLGEFRLVIDPYLSNSLSARGIERMIPVPLSLEALKPDLLCFTHDHADHFDEQTVLPLVAMYPDCKFLGPQSVFEHYIKLGLPPQHFSLLDGGETYQDRQVLIKAVNAYHTDKYAIGMLIWLAGKCLYISGDTLLEEGLLPSVEQTANTRLDAVFICINGKLGNMDADDAIKVVEQLKPRMVVPMHYGLFAENTVDPGPFVESVIKLGMDCMAMEPGCRVKF